MELGILGQWIANRGSYGPWEFIAPPTFDQLLPFTWINWMKDHIDLDGVSCLYLR